MLYYDGVSVIIIIIINREGGWDCLNNIASIFLLRRLHQDDNVRVITTLWTEAH